MISERGSNGDGEGGEERDEAHLYEGFQRSEKGRSSVGSKRLNWRSGVLQTEHSGPDRRDELKRWTDGGTPGPGLTDRRDLSIWLFALI